MKNPSPDYASFVRTEFMEYDARISARCLVFTGLKYSLIIFSIYFVMYCFVLQFSRACEWSFNEVFTGFDGLDAYGRRLCFVFVPY